VGNTVTVDVDFATGSDTEDADFIVAAEAALLAAANATTGVSYAAGTLTYSDTFVGTDLNFNVTAFNDDLLDSPETLNVTLDNATAVNGSATAADSENVTITDIDNAITFAINVTSEDVTDDTASQQATVTEENDLDDVATFTVLMTGLPLLGANTASVDVNFTGTADDADFVTAALASLTAIAGSTAGVSLSANTLTFDSSFVGSSLSFSVEVFDDGDDEGPEDLIATLSGESVLNGSAALVSGQEAATVDIDDADADFPAGLAYSIAGGGGTGAFLYGIDLASGATFQIGAVVVDGNDKAQFSSLTLNPIDGYLYGLADQGGLNGFARVNAATGEAELLFSDSLLNTSTSGMSFATNGDLYIGIDDEFYLVASIDVSSINDVSDLGSPIVTFDNSGVSIDSMAYQVSTDTIFFISGSQLFEIAADGSETTATEAPMAIGDTIDGLSFDESGTLWGSDNLGSIYRIDTLTGSGTLVATISNSDVTNSGIHSLAISQLIPGTYVTLGEGAVSHTNYYLYSVGAQGDVYDATALSGLGLTADSEVTISVTGRTISVTQTDTADPVDEVAIRVDSFADITIDGFEQSDIFTRDGLPSVINITDGEGGNIQTGEADDVVNITSAATSGGLTADEEYTVNTDGGDDVITLTDLVDTSYILNVGESLDANGNLLQDLTDIDSVIIDDDLNLGSGNVSMNNVEVLDITGAGDNTLTLTASDVLDASDDTNVLIVKGDSGDAIASSDSWAAGATGVTGIDGGTYNTYTFDTGGGIATLLVDSSINITSITD
ncbi:hypothetical protein A9Q78_09185, partial [Methylophaga sp. 41_12_T18]